MMHHELNDGNLRQADVAETVLQAPGARMNTVTSLPGQSAAVRQSDVDDSLEDCLSIISVAEGVIGET